MKTFLKWAGNKTSLRDTIIPLLGTGNSYYEPFLGAGAIYADVKGFSHYVLSDANFHLMSLYRFIQDAPETLIAGATPMFAHNNLPYYERTRELFNEVDRLDFVTASRVLYLNRHCYNGLWRVNKSNRFNVPFGRFKKPYLPAKEIQQWHEKLQRDKAILIAQDFEKSMNDACVGDAIYCDPPYFYLSDTSNFSAYATNWHHDRDTRRLAKACQAAQKRGITVVVSNSHSRFIHELFSEHGAKQFITVSVQRRIAANSEKRGVVPEYVIVF